MKSFTAICAVVAIASAAKLESVKTDVYEPNQYVPAFASGYGHYGRPRVWGRGSQYGRASNYHPVQPYSGWVQEDHPNMRLLRLLGRAPAKATQTWEKAECIEHQDEDGEATAEVDACKACGPCGKNTCPECVDCRPGTECAKIGGPVTAPDESGEDVTPDVWWRPTTTVRPGRVWGTYGKAPALKRAPKVYYGRRGY